MYDTTVARVMKKLDKVLTDLDNIVMLRSRRINGNNATIDRLSEDNLMHREEISAANELKQTIRSVVG